MTSLPESPYTVKRETKTRPASFGEAWAWSMWAGVAAAAATIGIVLTFDTGNLLWLALTIGASAFYLMLDNRKQMHDERAFNVYETWLEKPDEPQTESEPGIQPWIQNQNGATQHTRHGRFNLHPSKWALLAQTFCVQNKTLARDNIPGGIFTNITKNWPLWIEGEFYRMGWFDKTTNELTASGFEWFTQFLPPPPQTNGHVVGSPLATTTTTTATTGPGGVLS